MKEDPFYQMQPTEYLRQQASRAWSFLFAKEKISVDVVLQQRFQQRLVATEQRSRPQELSSMGNTDADDAIALSTLFAHLTKLGQDEEVQMAATIEAAIDQSDTPSPRHQGSSKAPRQVSTEIYTSINSGVIFKRDSARILRWMKCALEDLHIDAIIVASATTLALKYLRRRSLFSLVESLHHNGPAAGDLANNHRQQRVTLGNDVSRPSTSAKAAASDITSSRGMQRFGSQNQRWGRRKINQRAVLISVTCLHLASKYHSVHKESVANFGTRLNPEKVFQLGFEISLSMGTSLNASFRANPFALQNMFCSAAGESAVVRACSEWFALCMMLLVQPSTEGEGQPASLHRKKISSPTALVDAASTTSNGTYTTATSSTPTSSVGISSDIPFNSPVGFHTSSLSRDDTMAQDNTRVERRRDAGYQFSRATSLALGALVLARRLARSKGPCLPLRIQTMIGLETSEAFELVVQGIYSARRAFETEIEKHESMVEERDLSRGGASVIRKGGRDILAGDLVFGKVIDLPPEDFSFGSKRGSGQLEKLTLLEWVTACGEKVRPKRYTTSNYPHGLAKSKKRAPSGIDCLPNPLRVAQATAFRQNEPVDEDTDFDFVRGFPLVANAMGKTVPPQNSSPNTVFSDSHFGSAGDVVSVNANDGCDHEDSSTYFSVSSTSDTSDGRGGKEDFSRSSFAKVGGSWNTTAGQTSSEEKRVNHSPSTNSSPSPLNMSNIRTMCNGNPWNVRTPAEENSSPYTQYESGDSTAHPFFLRDDMDVDDGDDMDSPSTARESSPTSHIAKYDTRLLTATPLGEDFTAGWTGGKRVAPKEHNSYSKEGQNTGCKRLKTTTRDNSSWEDLQLLRSAKNPGEEHDARWEILKNRLLVALEYNCACSFCRLCGNNGLTTTDNGTISAAKDHPKPLRDTFGFCTRELNFPGRQSLLQKSAADIGCDVSDDVMTAKREEDSSIEIEERPWPRETVGSEGRYGPLLKLTTVAIATLAKESP